jgi:hypothetical protein
MTLQIISGLGQPGYPVTRLWECRDAAASPRVRRSFHKTAMCGCCLGWSRQKVGHEPEWSPAEVSRSLELLSYICGALREVPSVR